MARRASPRTSGLVASRTSASFPALTSARMERSISVGIANSPMLATASASVATAKNERDLRRVSSASDVRCSAEITAASSGRHDEAVADRDDPVRAGRELAVVRHVEQRLALPLRRAKTSNISPAVTLSRLPVGSSPTISFGSDGERPRDRDALLLAARQLDRKVPALVAQPDEIEVVPCALEPLALRPAMREVERERGVLERGERGQQLEELEHDPHVAPRQTASSSSLIESIRCPSTVTVPAVGRSIPVTRLRIVVLPLPDGPTIATSSPAPSRGRSRGAPDTRAFPSCRPFRPRRAGSAVPAARWATDRWFGERRRHCRPPLSAARNCARDAALERRAPARSPEGGSGAGSPVPLVGLRVALVAECWSRACSCLPSLVRADTHREGGRAAPETPFHVRLHRTSGRPRYRGCTELRR